MKDFTPDEVILNYVRGYEIEFNNAQPIQCDSSFKGTTVSLSINSFEENPFEKEIMKLKAKGVVEETHHSQENLPYLMRDFTEASEVSKRCIKALEEFHRWDLNLSTAFKSIQIADPSFNITADASRQSWSAVCNSQNPQLYTSVRWDVKEMNYFIYVLELPAIFLGLIALCSSISNQHVKV